MKSSNIKTIIFGLLGVGTVEVLTSYVIPAWIRNYSACYEDAMQCLRAHPEAVKQLGEPITDGSINYSDASENNANKDFSWYTVPVKGPKSNGKMRYWIAYDKEPDRLFRVVRVELQLNNLPDQILVLKRLRE